MSAPAPTERFLALAAKVDRFFDAAQVRFGDDMQCASRCADCCQGGLTVTSVEAAVIRDGMATLEEVQRSELSADAADASEVRCTALDALGQCRIYAWRPLVCRSHGVPIQVAPAMRGRLPVVQACPKNFTGGLEDVGADAMLDQTTLSTVLGAIDVMYADASGVERGHRTSITRLLLGTG